MKWTGAIAVALVAGIAAPSARADDAGDASAAQLAKACADLETTAGLRGARAAVSAARLAERADADIVRLFAAAFEGEALRRLATGSLDDDEATPWAQEHDKLLAFVRGRALSSVEPLLNPPSDVAPTLGWAEVANAVVRLLGSPAAAPGWTPAADSDPDTMRIRLQEGIVPLLVAGVADSSLPTPPLPAAICGFYESTTASAVCSSLDGQVARARELEQAGQCADLAALGDIIVARCPARPEGFGIRADAHRCSDEAWLAAREYREYVARGGHDAADLRARKDVESTLADLEVVVLTDESAGSPKVRLRVGEHEFRPDGGDAKRRFEFHLLPPNTPVALEFSGIGFERTEVGLDGLRSMEAKRHEQTLPWRGEARVRIAASAPLGDGEEWRLVSDERELSVKDGDSMRVTAGPGRVVLEVSSSLGVLRAPLDVAADAELLIDPADWIPALLTVQGAPSGSTLRLAVDGTTGRSRKTALETLQGGSGNRLAGTDVSLVDDVEVGPVVSGRGSLGLWHPHLGGYSDEVTLVAGRKIPATVVATRMSNYVTYRAAWKAHEDSIAKRSRQRKSGAAVLASAAIGAGAVAAILAAGSAAANQQALDAKATATQRPMSEARAFFAAYNGSVERSQALAVGAVVLGSTAAVMLAITIDFDLRAGRRLDFEPPLAEGAPDWAE